MSGQGRPLRDGDILNIDFSDSWLCKDLGERGIPKDSGSSKGRRLEQEPVFLAFGRLGAEQRNDKAEWYERKQTEARGSQVAEARGAFWPLLGFRFYYLHGKPLHDSKQERDGF